MKYLHLHYVSLLTRMACAPFWKILNYAQARLWKVSIGKHCAFTGRCRFRNLPSGSIRIGDYCKFNSSKTSNLMGVFSPCMISTVHKGAEIIIGNHCGFSGTVIGAGLSVTLGDGVRCGANTMITDTDWHPGDPRVGPDKPIVIEDKVWLGYGVKVLKGVRIGKGSLIGAGSIVTHDIPAGVIAAGVPCKVIRPLPADISLPEE